MKKQSTTIMITMSLLGLSPLWLAGCSDSHSESEKAVYYQDADLDGFGSADSTMEFKVEKGMTLSNGRVVFLDDENNVYVDNNDDCNNANFFINPSATEIIGDDIDNNCDGVIDEIDEVASNPSEEPAEPDASQASDADENTGDTPHAEEILATESGGDPGTGNAGNNENENNENENNDENPDSSVAVVGDVTVTDNVKDGSVTDPGNDPNLPYDDIVVVDVSETIPPSVWSQMDKAEEGTTTGPSFDWSTFATDQCVWCNPKDDLSGYIPVNEGAQPYNTDSIVTATDQTDGLDWIKNWTTDVVTDKTIGIINQVNAGTIETKTDSLVIQATPSTSTVVSAGSLDIASYVIRTNDRTYLVQLNSGAVSATDQLSLTFANSVLNSQSSIVSVSNISASGTLTSVPYETNLQSGNVVLKFNTISQNAVSDINL